MKSRRTLPALVAAAALVLGACGGSGGGSSGQPDKDGLNAEVASFDLATGDPARILVGVLSNDRRFLVFGTVQLRFAYLGTKQENEAVEYGQSVTARFLPVHGSQPPSPAPNEPVLSSDSRGVYAAAAGFAKAGFYQVEVTAKVDGEERKATAALAVNERHTVPGVGDQALATENLTVASTDAPKAAIDSRASAGGGEVPDAHLHQTTIAAALAAKRPAVVVFATPTYCQSQFCGPVTDLVGQLAQTYGDRASFIHVEIWRDFQNQTINRAAADWLLREGNLSEPWVFVIGANGRVTARFDNVATQEELEPILRQLPVIGPAT
ncbi:MAG: hypothetical protein ACRD2W_16875 [Acidimicrobiales bacterium]